MPRFLVAALAALLFAVVPAAAQVDEPAYIVVDADNGAILLHNQADQPWYPASVTKLMTAYLAFEALASGQLKPTSPVKISQHALDQAPSKMGYKVGTVLNVENALKMMLVKSANDIAVAIAETVGGNEIKFVALMNARAATLGMASTHFNNPNGLPDNGQYTTARDLAVLARAIWVDFPGQRDLFRIPAIKAGKKILRSQNRLLEQFRGATGMKTGFICASGFNIVASAERNGRHVIAVVLGATSSAQRTEAAARLLNQGFASWFGPGKPKLETFMAYPAQGAPVNMRDQVCGKGKPEGETEEEDPVLAKLGGASALVPRFVLMDPVPVFTGRADGMAETVKPGKPTIAGSVPLPNLRPRPQAALDTATSVTTSAAEPPTSDPFSVRFNPTN